MRLIYVRYASVMRYVIKQQSNNKRTKVGGDWEERGKKEGGKWELGGS